MERTGPTELLDLAGSDAGQTLERGHDLLISLDASDHAQRSMVHRAMCLASRFGASMEDSVRHGEESVVEADQTDDDSLRSWARVTLAGTMALKGETDAALRLLDEAARIATEAEVGVIQIQRAIVFSIRGESDKALRAYTDALPLLQKGGDPGHMAAALHNRGHLYILTGDLQAAEEDLIAVRDLYVANGQRHFLGGAEHNLGLLAAHRGDIPEALRRFEVSEALEKEETGSAIPVHSSRCEVLLSAGLFREALALADRIYEQHVRQGRSEDAAEALLVAAQAALLAADPGRATELARQAADMFYEQGRAIWRASADRIWVQASFDVGAADSALFDVARRVANELDGKLVIAAHNARLSAGLIALQLGDIESATQEFSHLSESSSGPVEIRLQSRLARAKLCLARQDLTGADAAARSGMRLLDQYQAAIGAADIRSGVERHAAALGATGLQLALQSARPRRVFSWMERTHAPHLRYRPVLPSDDALAGDLARLRKLTADLREASGDEVVRLSRQRRLLQEAIRNGARQASGIGSSARRTTPEDIAANLGDRTLVEFGSHDGTLWAVVVSQGRFRLREVGSTDDILSELSSLRFTMRRLARGRGSVSLASELGARLDRMLFGRLGCDVGPMVIVPTAELHAIPWWALPTCQVRWLAIAPSADLWLRARSGGTAGRSVLLVAGPDLEMSNGEVAEISELYPRAKPLTSADSTVDQVRAGLEGARVAHIASHAFFQFENPMFSSLRLADGDLNVYDIQRLRTAPATVVLSACDSGFSDTHAGEELMGLGSALLSMGTRSIIASVGLVPDSEATKELMVALHRNLIARRTPSRALYEAQMEVGHSPEGYVAASSFICIGAG